MSTSDIWYLSRVPKSLLSHWRHLTQVKLSENLPRHPSRGLFLVCPLSPNTAPNFEASFSPIYEAESPMTLTWKRISVVFIHAALSPPPKFIPRIKVSINICHLVNGSTSGVRRGLAEAAELWCEIHMENTALLALLKYKSIVGSSRIAQGDQLGALWPPRGVG